MAVAPTVSVIVTSYNYARFIGEAIQSVLGQTYRSFEVIVVDDGSTDDTRAVLDGFGAHIKCIYQANQGKSAALNRGIAAARGSILAFLDSDDAWLPDSLQVRLDALAAAPEAGVVYGRAQVVDGAGRLLPYTLGAPERYPGQTMLSLLCGVFVPFLTFMVRRSALEQVGAYFDPSLGATNDWELYLRLSRTCRFAFVDRPLGRYRVHGSNWSGDPEVMAAQMERVVEQALAAPGLPAGVERARPRVYRNLHTNIGLAFAERGRWREARAHFWRGLRAGCNPVWAAVRIAYLVATMRLSHSSLGASAVETLAAAKQRLNYALAGRQGARQ